MRAYGALVLFVLITPTLGSAPKLPEPPCYFATSVGPRYVYVFDKRPQFAQTITIVAVESDSKGVVVSEGTENENGIFVTRKLSITADGIAVLGNDGTAEWVLKAPYVAGTKWEIPRVSFEKNVIEVNIIKGEEIVEVPAGKFRAIRVNASTELFGKTSRYSCWYAKDVGLVKELDINGRETVLQTIKRK